MTAISTPSIRLRQVSRDEWTKLAAGFLDHGYTQSFDYGVECAKRQGATSEHVALEASGGGSSGDSAGGEVIALADVRVKRIPVVGGGMAYVSGGPLVRRVDCTPDSIDDAREFAARALIEEYTKRRHLVLRVLPPIAPPEEAARIAARCSSAGMTPSTQGRGYRTILLDLERSLDDIQKACSRRWRRGLGQARREDLLLKRSTERSAFDAFLMLHEQMKEKKGFHTDLDGEFYRMLQSMLPESERFEILLACNKSAPDRAVAGLVLSLLGDTQVYLLGASDATGRDLRASYALHWEAIENAKARGLSWYDLGGIDPVENPGVYEFKNGMGGIDVCAAGPFESVLPGWRGRLTRLAEEFVRKRRAVEKAPARIDTSGEEDPSES